MFRRVVRKRRNWALPSSPIKIVLNATNCSTWPSAKHRHWRNRPATMKLSPRGIQVAGPHRHRQLRNDAGQHEGGRHDFEHDYRVAKAAATALCGGCRDRIAGRQTVVADCRAPAIRRAAENRKNPAAYPAYAGNRQTAAQLNEDERGQDSSHSDAQYKRRLARMWAPVR